MESHPPSFILKGSFLQQVEETSGYATWFTAGGAIHEPQNP